MQHPVCVVPRARLFSLSPLPPSPLSPRSQRLSFGADRIFAHNARQPAQPSPPFHLASHRAQLLFVTSRFGTAVMRTNVQCLPEYQLDVGRVVVVVVVVRRGWIGGKSDAIHRGVDRSSSDKKGREGRKKDKGRIFRFGFRLVGRSTLNAMTRARVTREKARQGGGEGTGAPRG